MAAVSRVVRTPWVDLNAFAILAISCTGTKRTALVSWHLLSAVVLSLEHMRKDCMTSHILHQNSGDENRRYFEFCSHFFSLILCHLVFLCLSKTSQILHCWWCSPDVGPFVP